MKGMTVDKYGNITFTKESVELTNEELKQQFKSINVGPINETVNVVGNNNGSTTITTIDHIARTQTHQLVGSEGARGILSTVIVAGTCGNINQRIGCVDFSSSHKSKVVTRNSFFTKSHPDSALISEARSLYDSLLKNEKYTNERDVKELFEEFEAICHEIESPGILTSQQKMKIKKNVEEVESILDIIDNALSC